MKLREALRNITAELGRNGDHYSHNDIINELRRRRPDLIRAYATTLENTALKRILNDVESKQSKSFNLAQMDMFFELGGLPLSIPAGSGLPKGSRRFLQKMSIDQIRDYIRRDRGSKKALKKPSLGGLLAKAEAANCITSGDMSLEEVVKRMREKGISGDDF